MMPGVVHIVGAGPGDPELITVKALKRIQSADVILYDRLVDNRLLDNAKPGAQLIYCGKAPGAHAMRQEQIHKLLIQHALKGKDVVRLKGGDPYIFGRGGEEAIALAEKGITFEVVPGITAALGSAAAFDIPLTHRGSSASVAFVTGSRCSDSESPIRWDMLAHGADTLVIYMGISQLEAIRTELLTHGKEAETPVAIVERGSNQGHRAVTGTLGTIHKLAASMKVGNPALIIIGESVRVREKLNSLIKQAENRVG